MFKEGVWKSWTVIYELTRTVVRFGCCWWAILVLYWYNCDILPARTIQKMLKVLLLLWCKLAAKPKGGPAEERRKKMKTMRDFFQNRARKNIVIPNLLVAELSFPSCLTLSTSTSPTVFIISWLSQKPSTVFIVQIFVCWFLSDP